MERYGPGPMLRLDGDCLRNIFRASGAALESNVEAINALNVFPVPDGDTGTNMSLTMRAVNQEALAADGASAAAVVSAMARGALLGARGNSGVILCQFFRGLARGLEGKEFVEAGDLAQALSQAAAASYRAVSKPVEGTLLTVIKDAAQAACDLEEDTDIPRLWEAVSRAAADSVSRTPTLLPVLREAGVVDAGGQGLAIMLEAGLRYLRGEDVEAVRLEIQYPSAMPQVSEGFLIATEEEMYGYCTQLLIQGQGLQVDAIREHLASLAESTVVVGDETLVKVHVHTSDPEPIISYGASLGTLSQVKVDNIDEQHQEFLASHRRRQQAALPIAVVAVALGEGLAEVFRNLGASAVVSGGQTMNPSTGGLLEAVEGAPSEQVILLPNNSNVVGTAEQAVEVTSKGAHVVPTRTIPQGVAALLAFNLERDLQSNLAAMEAAQCQVKTGEVTRAVRSTRVSGVDVHKGQVIGLLEGELVVSGGSEEAVVRQLFQQAGIASGALVTLYWGEEIVGTEAGALADALLQEFPGVEVEVVWGGQPHYSYIISIE